MMRLTKFLLQCTHFYLKQIAADLTEKKNDFSINAGLVLMMVKNAND